MVDSNLFREIDRCRICSSDKFVDVIDLKMQSLTGCFPKADEPSPPQAPLCLVRCENCELVQLKHSVDTAEMFGSNYGYQSGLNESMRKHLASITTQIKNTVDFAPGDVVLDIGCNDGTLLKSYELPQVQHLGIDPVADMFRAQYGESLKVHTGFFDSEGYRALGVTKKAKAITSISMFYDLEVPKAFVKDIAGILDDQGVWVLEQSYLPTMLAKNSFDTICHEHLEYYALKQIEGLVTEFGLKVFDVRLNDINGGSFQVYVCHQNADYICNHKTIEQIQKQEVALELGSDKPYAEFRARVDRIGAKLTCFLKEQVDSGKKVYVYGASTKGNVLLQYFGIDHNLISACAERNAMKWGCKTPGTEIPIVSEQEAREAADYFLVLPWHFKQSFLNRERQFIENGGKIIFPLPEFDVVGRVLAE